MPEPAVCAEELATDDVPDGIEAPTLDELVEIESEDGNADCS